MRFRSLVGIILLLTILFSYVPVFSMDQCPKGNQMDKCPEGNHMVDVKLHCGYNFHCPMIVNKNILETHSLPLNGRFVPVKPLLYVDELIRVVFRPPKNSEFIFRDEGKEVI